MKPLMKTTLSILLSFSMLGLAGCDSGSKESSRDRVRRGGAVGGNGVDGNDGSQINSGDYQGAVIGSPQNAFQEAVSAFFSSTENPSTYLGYVSGTASEDTGVYFDGRAEITGGFNPNSSNNGDFHSNAAFQMLLKFGYQDSNGNDAYGGWEYKGFRLVSGDVSGSRVNMVFDDGYGEVRLSGEYDATWFWGTLSFSNQSYWDGLQDGETSGASGTMGTFYIKTCSYFVCN